MDNQIEDEEIKLLSRQIALAACRLGLSAEVILKPLVRRETDMNAQLAAVSAMMLGNVNKSGEKNPSEECAESK